MKSTMRFFKIYEKLTYGIFLIFLMESQHHEDLQLNAMIFVGTSYTGDANEDIPSCTLHVNAGKSGISQILQWPITKIVLLVKNHFNSLTKKVKQRFLDVCSSWENQIK